MRTLGLVLALALGARVASAEPALIAVVPGPGSPGDDARQAVALGPAGEVYAPDGHGGWVHHLPSTTAAPLTAVSVSGVGSGSAIVALGDGVVYRLADNGWSAIRLVQHGKAVLGGGSHALAAVGRQIFTLDQLTRGEPTKLMLAPAPVTALAAGAKAVIVATDAATYRAELGAKPGKLVALPPGAQHARLISDRWAITERGALELPKVVLTRWPAGLTIAAAAPGPDDTLVAVATSRAGLELVTVRSARIDREPIAIGTTTDRPADRPVAAVGVVVDRQGRAVVALADGRLAVRGKAGWTVAQVRDEPPAAHPGAGPASSP